MKSSRRIPGAFLLSHPAHFIALGFGSGLAPVAPGTFGTLAGWVLHALLAHWLTPFPMLVFAVVLFFVGVWACERTGKDLGVTDHGGIVIDEVAAFMAVLAFTPGGWAWQLLAFGLFRLFDITKPPPIRYFEHAIPGGMGVMVDDALAAGYTLLVLALVVGVIA